MLVLIGKKSDKTVINISDYINEKIPHIAADDFAVRLLVKKDQQLDKLTFVSFRILCTDILYNKLKDPDFWPLGIRIGDFIEKPVRQTLETFVQPHNLIEMQVSTQTSPPNNVQINQSTVNSNSIPTQEEVQPQNLIEMHDLTQSPQSKNGQINQSPVNSNPIVTQEPL